MKIYCYVLATLQTEHDKEERFCSLVIHTTKLNIRECNVEPLSQEESEGDNGQRI